jgi:hypothetical protein
MAIESQGAFFYLSTTTSLSTAIAVGQVTGFNGPSGSANVIDVTHLQSTAKEKMIGLRDEGQITLDLNCVPGDSGQTKLRECRANRTACHWALKLNDTAITQLDSHGYISGYAITGSVDNKVNLSVTIVITGGVTWSTVA